MPIRGDSVPWELKRETGRPALRPSNGIWIVIATAYMGVFLSLIFVRLVTSGKGKAVSEYDSGYMETVESLCSDEEWSPPPPPPPSDKLTLNMRVSKTVTLAGGFSSPARLGPMKFDEVPIVYAREMGPRDPGEALAALPGSSSAEMRCILVDDPR